MPDPMKIPKLIEIMQEKSCTAHELALAANVSPTSIAKLRAGDAVSAVTVTNILSALEANIFKRKKSGKPTNKNPDIKVCAWCSGTITRNRKSQSEWEVITTCSRSCASFYKFHKCKKEDSPNAEQAVTKYCRACNALLVRKEKEHLQAWLKRRCCNKSCAAKVTGGLTIKPKIIASEHERLHVKHYIPGTPEFEQIARQYMERR